MTSLIDDPHFRTLGEPGSRWTVAAHAGVTVVPTVEGSVLRLEIAHASGVNWHGELRHAPFPVAAGDTLSVSFAARARVPFAFSVWLGQQDPPHQSLVPPQNHFGEKWMTSEWQTFAHSWQAGSNEPAARLNFVLGQIDNTVELKEITLTRLPAGGPVGGPDPQGL